MSVEVRRRNVFLVLLRDERAATTVAQALDDLGPESGSSSLIPPVRGAAFFSDARHQAEIDRWWADRVPEDVIPVYLLEHEDGLARWLPGLDGVFYIAGVEGAAAAYDDVANAHVIDAAGNPLAFAQAVLAHEDRDVSARPRTEPLNPFDVLSTMLGNRERAAGSPSSPDDVQPVGTRVVASTAPSVRTFGNRLSRLPFTSRGSRPAQVSDAELCASMCERGSTVVAVGSRKGGVGKTSHAAGMAVIAGTALDLAGRRAALVDANLANPDAWGQLNLPAGAATVRAAVTALMNGEEVPRPVHASTPGLACFPESREGVEYSRVEIQRLAAYLRARYTVTVVDLTNRLPDALAGPEAAAAAYWLEEADVLLLPSASSKQEFNGVLDYLELDELPPTVVAHIVPRSRRNREHPLARKYLEAIRMNAHRVVTIPDDGERVRYAVMEGVPVQEVSSALRRSYRELLVAVVEAAGAERS